MKLSTLTAQRENLKLEIAANVKSLANEIRAGKITRAEADKKIGELRSRKTMLDKKIALFNKPKGDEKRSGGTRLTNADFIKAAAEKRSLTLAGNGAVNQVKEIIKAIVNDDSLLNEFRYYYGANSETNIPVLSPRPAVPAGQAEGASGIADDSTAAMGVTALKPIAFVSILPVTLEALKLNSIDIESELNSIFDEAFREAMHTGALTGDGAAIASGSGNKMKGLFTAAAANTAGQTTLSGSTPTLAELANLAVTVRAKKERFEIVVSPSIYAAILADTSTNESTKIYKESLIRDKEIEGVKVRIDADAPSATSTGSVEVVAAPLGRYAMGVASEIIIDPIKVKGDTKTYFQAAMFFTGAPILDGDVYSLVVA